MKKILVILCVVLLVFSTAAMAQTTVDYVEDGTGLVPDNEWTDGEVYTFLGGLTLSPGTYDLVFELQGTAFAISTWGDAGDTIHVQALVDGNSVASTIRSDISGSSPVPFTVVLEIDFHADTTVNLTINLWEVVSDPSTEKWQVDSATLTGTVDPGLPDLEARVTLLETQMETLMQNCTDLQQQYFELKEALDTHIRIPFCGDDVVDSGEECDQGTDNSDTPDAYCRTDCNLAGCGDSIVDSGEECDDGNTIDDDACSNSCLVNEQCLNIVTNGDFSAGTAPWFFYTNGVGQYSVIGGEAEVAITTQGTNVQLSQTQLVVEGDTQYRLTFKGRHSTGRDVIVQLIKNTAPYTNCGLSQTVDLASVMQPFSIEFMTPPGGMADARLMFYMAPYDQDGTTYFFDDVVLCAIP